jgi:predicted  nucleic acid-binding Zn-ribbon protein
MSEEQSKGNNTNKILIAICILLALGCAFFAYKTFNPKNSVEYITLLDQKQNLDTDYQTTLKTLDESKSQLAALQGQNEDMDKMLEERETALNNLKAQYETLNKKANKTSADKSKMQAIIDELQSQNKSYLEQIQKLAEEKKILIEENTKLSTDLTSEKETTKKLTTDKTYLQGKFELGKLLKTQNIIAVGVKAKSGGKEIETNKINKLDKIKVCFETGDNKVLDPGNVTLYLRLINPQGNTIVQESMGSGIIKLSDGTDAQFTKSVDFAFQGASKKMCIYWSQNIYTEGKYKAEVYQSGYKIGETSFDLK